MIERIAVSFTMWFTRVVKMAAFLVIGNACLRAQEPISIGSLADIVYLDSIMVTASKSDFSVQDFIHMVLNDESFYEAFRNLRGATYTLNTDMSFVDRHENLAGAYHAVHKQVAEDSCWRMLTLSETWSGDIRKKRKEKYRYYTAEMYERLFLYSGLSCPAKSSEDREVDKKGMEGHIEELKKLIFSPGSSSGVPLVGKKTAIFTGDMREYYNFHIRSGMYRDKIDAYIFEAILKPEFSSVKDNHTVIKELTTYFSKGDFQILGRHFELAHFTLLYDFDVIMDVELTNISGKYFPLEITYEGFWNIPFHRKEDGQFKLVFSQYDAK